MSCAAKNTKMDGPLISIHCLTAGMKHMSEIQAETFTTALDATRIVQQWNITNASG